MQMLSFKSYRASPTDCLPLSFMLQVSLLKHQDVLLLAPHAVEVHIDKKKYLLVNKMLLVERL